MSDTNMRSDVLFSAEYAEPNVATKHQHIFRVDYAHPDGSAWTDYVYNIVPDAALNVILDTYYGSTAKDSGKYVGLVTGPGASNTYAAGDTMSAHAGWAEAVPYSDATRPAATFGSASGKSISNGGSPSAFNCNATATVAGCFLVTNNTKSGSSGTLVGVGNFSGGDRAVASGGTLTVTVTATAATA